MKTLKKSVLKENSNEKYFCVREGDKLTLWVDNGGQKSIILKTIEYQTVRLAKKALNLFAMYKSLPIEVQ